ncbi:uncharacterized protein VP01_1956g2 [Puccinia sorghi]|uniref:Uncharacterized protein n=1 Tax=Puccinia sorghi TaxID=27349 RepID=A0A0L6VCJ9_9BASI|nr:uncharacterized protein VP01_1956g2 [Puccinia sorghi]
MRFSSWLLYANFCYNLTYCSLNESILEEQDTSGWIATSLVLPGTVGPRYGPRRPILRLRQLPGSVQTVTATVTLTVTNIVFSTPSLTLDLPSTSTPDSPQPTNPTHSSSRCPKHLALLTSSLPLARAWPHPPLPLLQPLPPRLHPPHSLLFAHNHQTPRLHRFRRIALYSHQPRLLQVLRKPLSRQVFDPTPTHEGEKCEAEVSGADSGAGEADDSSESRPTGSPRGLTRLVILCIVITVISSLGLVAVFLLYLSPYMQDARLRRHAKSGSIFVEDYSASARTFHPNPTGALNYQRSLSRKRNRRAHLLPQSHPPPPTKIPRPPAKTLSLEPGLWLPQTSAGPGLSRPVN